MKIQFSEISSTGTTYTFDRLAVPCDKRDFELQGPARFSCTVRKKGKRRVLLQGTVQATLLLSCNRCLTTFSFQVDSDLHLIYEVPDTENHYLREIDLSSVELDIVEIEEPVLDLEDIARQQLYMALPVRMICSEQCRGICPECGSNQNDGPCGCSGENKNSPFAVLAALKDKEK